MSDVKDQVVRVGVIGLGFMGATHLEAYRRASDAGVGCVVVAVCDRKAHRRAGQIDDTGGNLGESPVRFDPLALRAYADPADLLATPDIDLVSICTPTDSHVDLAIAALKAGKHVLVEKPVALRSADVRRVEAAAQESARLCMPALCMRFWPAWSWLKQRIEEQAFGPCRGLTLTRIGSAPQWSSGFYSDPARSGGALVDLHIHDADFVRWCFGDPPAVTSAGAVVDGAINHVTTIYHFDHPVVAEGGWLAAGTPFSMRYLAEFADAVADFDLGRDSQLLLHHAGQSQAVHLSPLSGYDVEIRHLVEAITTGRTRLDATLADASAVADLLEAERISVLSRRRVEL